jgi:hypothetical protein
MDAGSPEDRMRQSSTPKIAPIISPMTALITQPMMRDVVDLAMFVVSFIAYI